MKCAKILGALILLCGACGGDGAGVTGEVDGEMLHFSEGVYGVQLGPGGNPAVLRLLLVNELDGRCIDDRDPSPERLTVEAKWLDLPSLDLATQPEACGQTGEVPFFCATDDSEVLFAHVGTRRDCSFDTEEGWCRHAGAVSGALHIDTPMPAEIDRLPDTLEGGLSFLFRSGPPGTEEAFSGTFQARHCPSLDRGAPQPR